MNTLKYVRPGNNFELNPAITVLAKGDVNGANQQPLFKWMKSEIMIPTGGDDESCLVDTNDNGCGDADALVLPRGGFGGKRMADGLVIAVAAAAVVECIDFQRHAGVFIRIVCGN